MRMAMGHDVEMFPFDVEFNQIVSLIINKFKRNKDIFLHKLISNSSYALDKLQYETTVQPFIPLLTQDETTLPPLNIIAPPFIHIYPDKTNNTLTIVDNGPGMTWPDLACHLGTISRSRTKDFMQAFVAGADVTRIGQFGFGFYFAFLVAHKVVVRTKHAYDFHYIWETQADGSFTIIRDINCPYVYRGSRMTLYLKEDQLEYLDEERLEALIKMHSAPSRYPISLGITRFSDWQIPVGQNTETLNVTRHSILRVL